MIVYYQPGIGTFTPPGLFFRTTQLVVQVLDQALAWYLEDHVVGFTTLFKSSSETYITLI